MSLFNDKLKNIRITSIAIFLIVSYLVVSILGKMGIFIDYKWIYVFIILYFIIILKDYSSEFKIDLSNIFSKVPLKTILLIVFLNIFFSYGMLYLADYMIVHFPFLNFLVEGFSSKSLVVSLPIIGSFLSTVVVAPISEELIFRGVFTSRLKLFVPTVFAVIISSLLFASLHSFGSIFSAFIFGLCMALLYLKTENICVAIFAHFLNNLFAELIRMGDFNNLLFVNTTVMVIMSILAIISAIILFVSIYKELNNIK